MLLVVLLKRMSWEVERHLLAWLFRVVTRDKALPAVGGARETEQEHHDHNGQRQLGRSREALHC
jgi:hypothetical protein